MRGPSRTLLIAASLTFMLAGGCSSDDDGDAPDDSASIEVIAPELPPAVGLDGVPRTPLATLETARLTLDSPDWMASTAGALWVRLDTGEVVRVDPTRAKVVATVRPVADSQFSRCQALGAGTAVWACGREYVQRIDPKTNQVGEHFDLDVTKTQGHVAVVDGKAWFLTDGGASLTTIAEDSSEVSEPMPLGTRCSDLATDGATIWAACVDDDRVLDIDPATGQVTRALSLDAPQRLMAGDYLWVSSSAGVVQVVPDDLSVKAVFDLGPVDLADPYEGPDAAWVRTTGGPFLVGIDAQTSSVFAVVTAPDLESGGNSQMIDGQLWATAYNDAALVRLTPPTG